MTPEEKAGALREWLAELSHQADQAALYACAISDELRDRLSLEERFSSKELAERRYHAATCASVARALRAMRGLR